jgi:DNA replication ATP-dependent helicase Dna2
MAPPVTSKVTTHHAHHTAVLQQENSIQEAAGITQAIAPDYPLVFLDVRGEVDKGIMKTSDAEARAIRDLIAALLTRGVRIQDIGIIAPYRAQVANIRRHLLSSVPEQNWTGLTPETLPTVDTVDRFQGGERRIIIMSFATTSAPQGERLDFLTNPNRLNVALTRAQRKLILVGCVPVLENLNIFERLVRYCRSMKTVIPYV